MHTIDQFNQAIDELNSGKPIIEITIDPHTFGHGANISKDFRLCDAGARDFGQQVYITIDPDGRYTIHRSGFGITDGSEYGRILDRARYMASTQVIHDGDEVIIVEQHHNNDDPHDKVLLVKTGTVHITDHSHVAEAGYID